MIFLFLFFRIKHFAGTVKYDARDFVIRNLDSLDKDLSTAMYSCNHPLLKVLFPEGKSQNSLYRCQKCPVWPFFSPGSNLGLVGPSHSWSKMGIYNLQ